MAGLSVLVVLLFVSGSLASGIQSPPQDAFNITENRFTQQQNEELCIDDPGTFTCQWFNKAGDIVTSANRPGSDYIQVAATTDLDPFYHTTGTDIVFRAFRNMEPDVFQQFATYARVGLFTFEMKTTIFPEYVYYRDRPECAGICTGACSNTCTGDGRKYDSLAGVGGVRGTCLDDNFMCTADDPYGNGYNVLIHEVAHTVHQYALPSQWKQAIADAYNTALSSRTWDITSYAMSNELEYFAEATAVYFNVNFHSTSSGGMNSCGYGPGQYCTSESEARYWLWQEDIAVYTVLYYVYTDGTGAEGGLTVCP